MDVEQLARELEMLKAESAAGKAEKRMGGFIDKYGTKFNGNTDIANLILAEMDRRGVSEASEAASEAVQSVLDRLREEATAILDETKGAMAQVNDLVTKIDGIQQSVDAATAGAMPAPMPGEEGMSPMPPEGGMDAGMTPPPVEEPPAPEVPAEVPPPAEVPADAGMLPEGGEVPTEAPPIEEAPPPEEEAPPPTVPSDVRLKNIKSKFAAYAASKKAPTVPSDKTIKNVWKPPKHLIDGIRGGL